MFGNITGLFNTGLSSLGNKQLIEGSVPGMGTAQNIQGIQPQYGAFVQHTSAPIGYHQTRPTQNTSALAPQGIHSFTPQGQQFANQQALAAQQAAEQKRLADALKAQQEAEAAAQAQANEGGGYYSG